MKINKLLVIGGNGYVGKSILKKLSKIPKIEITSVQRSEINSSSQIKNIEYIQGDANNPGTFSDYIKEADTIIHTVGTLLDSTILKNKKKGSEGSYEHLNYETAKSMGEITNSFTDKKRRFLYLSANKAPPFLKRYLDTKLKAEMFLNLCENIEFFSLRPGFIIDETERNWSKPFGEVLNFIDYVQHHTPLNNLKNCNSDFLNQFEIEKPISKDMLTNSICELALFGNKNGNKKFFLYDDMKNLSDKFDERSFEE